MSRSNRFKIDITNAICWLEKSHQKFCSYILIVTVLFAFSSCDITQNNQDEDPQGQEEVEFTTQEVTAQEADDARTFWTSERMAEAQPYNVNGIGQDEEQPPPSTEPDVPGPNVEMQQMQGEQPSTAKSAPLKPVIQSDSQVDEGNQVSSNYTQYPYRTVGKVFFTKDGNWFSCSAAVIASENRSVVWTAGHCIADQGSENWHDRWIFVPAYKDGNAPLGRWSARTKATIVAWYSGGNRNYDLGAAVVEQKDNRPIASVTGSLGWMFNAQRSQDWRELGYPGAGSLFNGQRMWECFAPYDGADGVGSNGGPRTSTNTNCEITAGSSGGPWVVAFENCPQCYINGVNSWWWWRNGHSNVALQWASPYHGSAGLNLLQFAENL